MGMYWCLYLFGYWLPPRRSGPALLLPWMAGLELDLPACASEWHCASAVSATGSGCEQARDGAARSVRTGGAKKSVILAWRVVLPPLSAGCCRRWCEEVGDPRLPRGASNVTACFLLFLGDKAANWLSSSSSSSCNS